MDRNICGVLGEMSIVTTDEIADLSDPAALDARGRRLFDYWREKRGSRKMPARADIEPTDIPELLSEIGLVDVLPHPPHLRYRLAGTRQVAARGYDPTGKPVAECHLGLGVPGMLARVLANYERVIADRRPLFRDLSIPGNDNRGDILFGARLIARFTLFLPLATDGEKVDMVLTYTRFEEM